MKIVTPRHCRSEGKRRYFGTARSSSWADVIAWTGECGQGVMCSGSVIASSLKLKLKTEVESESARQGQGEARPGAEGGQTGRPHRLDM